MPHSPADAPHHFLAQALPVLARTPGVLGVTVGGSWVEQALDAYSDLDLVVVTDPTQQDRLLQARPALAASLGLLLECFTGEHVGEPRLLICLYDEPLLHVDLKLVALPDLAQRVEDPQVLWQVGTLVSDLLHTTRAQYPPAPALQWVEDRFWIWVHYAATKLGRGELLEVVSFLDYLRSAVFGPLLAQHHHARARGVRKLEQVVTEAELALIAATVVRYDRPSCAAGIRQAIACYRTLRRTDSPAGFVEKTKVEQRALAYLDAVAS